MDFSGCDNVNYTPTLTNWAHEQGLWEDAGNGYAPEPGSMIMYDWGGGRNSPDHVGLVVSYDPNTGNVTTIEGNTGDSEVDSHVYNINDNRVMGFIRCNM